MITNPSDFLLPHFEELEHLMDTKQWEDADILVVHLSEYMHLFDAEMLDKYYEWVDNIQYGLGYE
jgi:hypothetical protein